MKQKTMDRAALRTLVVEDEPLQRWILGEALREMGVGEVIEAADGNEALHLFTTSDFDLVITDLNMPGMDGIGFLRMLATIRWQCPVAITSAMDEDLLRLVEEALAESGSQLLAVLPKPIERDRLADLLNRTLYCTPRARRPPPAAIPADELRQALAADAFELHFQPKIDLVTGRVAGLEALARWQHPTLGWIPPLQFIPILERDSGIVDLTLKLIAQACATLRRMDGEGFPLKVAINLSRSIFADTDIVDRIADIAASRAVAPERLLLEITETAVERDTGNMLASLARLKMKGFRLSIDDFGTGYSSMQALVRVPFDELKIDRNFVTGATRNPRSRIVLESTIQLAHRLGHTTVAEGVESNEELAILLAARCHQVQGYLFGRPMPETALLDWLRSQPERWPAGALAAA